MALTNADTIANTAGTGAPTMSFGYGVPIARYKNALNASDSTRVFPSATTQIINFDTVEYDTNSAVTTGAAWKFTAPFTGKYRFAFFVHASSAAFNGITNAWSVRLFKNGSVHQFITRDIPQGTTTVPHLGGSGTVPLTAGDTADLRMLNDVSTTIENDNNINWVTIEYVGA